MEQLNITAFTNRYFLWRTTYQNVNWLVKSSGANMTVIIEQRYGA